MKWVNHAVCTASILYCFTGSFLFSGLSLIGVSIPDRLDGRPPDKETDYDGYTAWAFNHRGISHCFIPYLFLLFVIEFLVRPGMVPSHLRIYLYYLEFVVIGSLLHILEDMLCGKVPVWGLKHRFGFQLFGVGTWKEYSLTLFIVLASVRFDVFGFYYDLMWSFRHFVAEIF